MASDLHMHTTFSDGRLTPEEIIAAAKEAGLSYIAITDHDTVDGVRELYEQGRIPQKDLQVLAGIELSSAVDGHDVHILGYGIDIYNQELREKLEEVAEARWMRFEQMITKLQELGYDISEADVLTLAGVSRSIGRSHVARTLVKKGQVESVREVFSNLLDRGCPAYVARFRLTPEECVSLIRTAGGLPVLAHPTLVKDDALVKELLALDFAGMEVFYPQHDAADTARYLAMAQEHGLFVTGGSDYHALPSREPQELGVFTIEDKYAAQLLAQVEALC